MSSPVLFRCIRAGWPLGAHILTPPNTCAQALQSARLILKGARSTPAEMWRSISRENGRRGCPGGLFFPVPLGKTSASLVRMPPWPPEGGARRRPLARFPLHAWQKGHDPAASGES